MCSHSAEPDLLSVRHSASWRRETIAANVRGGDATERGCRGLPIGSGAANGCQPPTSSMFPILWSPRLLYFAASVSERVDLFETFLALQAARRNKRPSI